ncbi:hypothetical protein, partial [Methanosphaera sp. DEW79]|uniref:hypothetical protein n=1 Tax=Methanosphaera sp. DEW79 TaxID=1945576 RepID=UPI00257E9ED9
PLFFGLSSVFLVFLGLPGPLFFGGSCFSIIVVVCLLVSSTSILSSVLLVFLGLPGPLFLGFSVFSFILGVLVVFVFTGVSSVFSSFFFGFLVLMSVFSVL